MYARGMRPKFSPVMFIGVAPAAPDVGRAPLFVDDQVRHKQRLGVLLPQLQHRLAVARQVGAQVDQQLDLEHLAKPSSQPAATLPGMGKQLVSDELWEAIEPLLPPEPPKPRGGRPRVPNRAALTGIVFVLKSGIPWEMLPQEMGCGSGSTCWRRLKEWHEAGVWEKLHGVLLDRLGEADEIDWERASLDSASVPAKRGAKGPARTRRIKANRARSATLFRTEGVSRSR
jgi:transposase